MMHIQCIRSTRRLGTVVACVAVLGGCGSSPSDTDPRFCAQTYEFGNYGCTDVAGQVLGSAGQPLPGMFVSPGYLSPRDGFNSPYSTTDAEGRFGFRLTRFGAPPPVGGPDTVSLYIRALDPRSAGVNIPAMVRDSVLIQVTLAPVGALAPATNVEIRLSIP